MGRSPSMTETLRYLRAVLWSFAGIRQRREAESEQAQFRPVPLILTALAVVAALVALLLLAARQAAAAPLEVPDTLAQRTLACTGCHGPQGRSTPLGYVPRIAGKPAGYLAAQLRAFRDGQRQHDGMARLLVHLDDGYLAEIASHFAGLQVAYPAPAPLQGSAQTRAAGERLALHGDRSRRLPACADCHGARLTGVQPAIPGLLGLPRDYLVAQLGAWRIHVRKAAAPDCMAELASRLAPSDITAVADYLAAQPLPANTDAAPASTRPLPLPCGSVRP